MFLRLTMEGGQKVVVNLNRIAHVKPNTKTGGAGGSTVCFNPGDNVTGIPSDIGVEETYQEVLRMLAEANQLLTVAPPVSVPEKKG